MKLNSLRTKVNTAILATCLIITACYGVVLYPVEINRRQAHFNHIFTLLSTVFQQQKEQIANEIFAGQEKALSMSLSELLNISGITAAAAFNSDGNLLISTNKSAVSELTGDERKILKTNPLFSEKTSRGQYVAEFAASIQVTGEHVGYLKLLFDLSNLKRESNTSLLLFILLLSTLLFTVSVFLNIFLTNMVIKPATLLQNAIRHIREGRLGEQVRVASSDEVGQMAVAFNAMSTQLQEQHLELVEAIQDKEAYSQQIKETNQSLEKLNIELEDRVKERTRDLLKINDQLQRKIIETEHTSKENRELQERLSRSQKMEAMGLLAGGVAHDLNNVLSGIVSYPDLLLMDLPINSPLRKPILTIQSSGQKAAAIVQDLLTLARRGVANCDVLSLNAIVSEYLNSPEHEMLLSHHRSVQVAAHLYPQLLLIRGSAIHLKKSVMNLVANAAEAQPDGGTITIKTENRYLDKPLMGYETVKEGDYVVLSVADTGTGISPADLPRIFEPFYSRKVMGRSGTGLGMAVVWGTVQDHSGYIHVESVEGKGSVFELYFPVSRENLIRNPDNVPVEDYRGNGESILVIDDIPEQREIAFGILTRLGYSVSLAPSGEDAVSYLQTHFADLIILDMIMEPGMDGLKTFHEIIAIHPDQRAVIASGFAENDRVRKVQALGAGRYIRKPYTLEKIGLAVKYELMRQ
ncbi:MAG: response regulator [Deltaproteobacteria bacterium]|nr:response regulator [Deltaproteobacteria bacterium]